MCISLIDVNVSPKNRYLLLKIIVIPDYFLCLIGNIVISVIIFGKNILNAYKSDINN